jgi:thiol-disulfide isomerase/thioredoxin
MKAIASKPSAVRRQAFRLCALFACIALLAATQPLAPATFDPATLKVGKPAGIANAGKPTVVVMFASWCAGCIEELPTVIRDYTRFKDRVTFIGIDYLDNAKAGAAMVQRYHVPFDVFLAQEYADAPPPIQPGATPSGFSLHLNGMPPSMLARIIPGLEKQLPPEDITILKNVANACAHLDDASCRSYALGHGVDFGPPPSVSPMPAPSVRSSPGSQDLLSLPHLFVIDAQGIVRADIDGYTPGDDAIARELSKLGIH